MIAILGELWTYFFFIEQIKYNKKGYEQNLCKSKKLNVGNLKNLLKNVNKKTQLSMSGQGRLREYVFNYSER